MTLMEKFASLTPEQREKFAAVKDAAALDAFASEHGITLTDEEKAQAVEYFEKGILPLSDDDVDAVAGGGPYPLEYILANATYVISAEELAREDGRFHNVKSVTGLCQCSYRSKWARSQVRMQSGTQFFPVYDYCYHDIKCYQCGKQWNKCPS